jgi:2-phosphosulfolactate phosphatase
MPDESATPWFGQDSYAVRFDWGLAGAAALSVGRACVVVVDVLSFTTSVSVAVERGIRVFPHTWHDSAADRAREVDAVLAVGRRRADAEHPWTLSPSALRHAPTTARLVLPSPNGSAVTAAAEGRGAALVVAACLRNADAVGRWLAAHGYGTTAQPVAVIAAGERWPDGSLRPSIEDGLGAGAVLDALLRQPSAAPSPTRPAPAVSPEANWLRAAYLAAPDVAAAVTNSASGRELSAAGFANDVAIAVELDHSTVVPILIDGAFTAADTATD